MDREIHLVGHDLKQLADTGFREAVELGAHAAEIELHRFVCDLEDQLVAFFVDEGACVVYPSREGGSGGVLDEGDARLAYIVKADDDLGGVALGVVADGVGDEFLLQTFEVEVAAVAQELGAVVAVANGEGVAAKEVEEFGEDVGGAVGDGRGADGRGAEEAHGMEAREDVGGGWAGGGVEEGGEAEGEEVRGVADVGEDVARDLEVFAADLDDGFGVEELGDEAGYFGRLLDILDGWYSKELTAIELRVGENLDIVGPIFGLYHVAFVCRSVLSSISGGAAMLPCRCLHISRKVAGSRSI